MEFVNDQNYCKKKHSFSASWQFGTLEMKEQNDSTYFVRHFFL